MSRGASSLIEIAMTETTVAPATRTAHRHGTRLLLVLFLSFGFVFLDRRAARMPTETGVEGAA